MTPLPTTATPTRIPTPNPTPTEAAIRLTNAPDRDLYSLVRRLRPDLEQPIERVVNPEPVSYEAGRQDVFWVADLESLEMYEVEATLAHVSKHAYWYFPTGQEPRGTVLPATARVFDEVIYPIVTATFGSEWSPGIDNDPRLTILHAPLRSVAGYYNAADEYPKSVYPFSNEREMLYMNNWRIGTPAYLGTLAHELQHAVHWAGDPGEETWVNEGLSEVAKYVADYGLTFINSFITSPSASLTVWPSRGEATRPHYGAASLFMEYLAQRYGGHDNLSKLVAQPEDGTEGVTAYLRSLDYDVTFQDVFRDWLVANYLDSRDIDRYSYEGLDIAIRPGMTLTRPGSFSMTTPQYAGEYVEIRFTEGDAMVSFQGRTETPLLPTSAYSGSHCWWGNSGDAIDSTLTLEVDLSQVSQATLNFQTWYAIDESWDYAYVEVSSDGGETWEVLEGRLSSPQNPLGVSFGPGYTGRSDGWQEESVDLAPYTGEGVLLRFEYVTDEGTSDDGICIDDVSIPEIGYFDDVESAGLWDAQGFIRTNTLAPQDYLVQVVEIGDEVNVRQMALDQDGSGTLTLSGFGEGLERAVVIVAPIAPKTAYPASYVLSVDSVP